MDNNRAQEFLADAIRQLDSSFGDVHNLDHKHDLQTMAIASALISIASSLQQLSEDVKAIKSTMEEQNA
jgi:hypothetical protein